MAWCSWWPWASGPGCCTAITRPGGAGATGGPARARRGRGPAAPAGPRRTKADRVARRPAGAADRRGAGLGGDRARNAGSPRLARDVRTSREPGRHRLAADSGVFDDAAIAVALTAYSRMVGETHRNHDRGRAWWGASTLQRLLPRRPGPPRDPGISVTLRAGIREPRRRPLPAHGTTPSAELD